MENEYGVCKKCGAEMVKSPKTGKVFCSAKCWLNNAPKEADQGERLIKGIEIIYADIQLIKKHLGI
jgi:uncharacterized Zn finger protein (UPF0148 family)